MGQVPTVTIAAENGDYVIINASDFDPQRHRRFEDAGSAGEKPQPALKVENGGTGEAAAAGEGTGEEAGDALPEGFELVEVSRGYYNVKIGGPLAGDLAGQLLQEQGDEEPTKYHGKAKAIAAATAAAAQLAEEAEEAAKAEAAAAGEGTGEEAGE